MKNLITAAFLSFALSVAQAQTPTAPVLPETLAKTMKGMSSDLKTISAQSTKPEMNSASAAIADDFIKLATHAKDFSTDVLKDVPADQLAAAKAEFDKMLDQAVSQGQQLAAALRANDNTQAVAILNQLVQTKKDGHSKFKKDN